MTLWTCTMICYSYVWKLKLHPFIKANNCFNTQLCIVPVHTAEINMPQLTVTSHILAIRSDFGVFMHIKNWLWYHSCIHICIYPLTGVCSGAYFCTYIASYIFKDIYMMHKSRCVAAYVAHSYTIHFATLEKLSIHTVGKQNIS